MYRFPLALFFIKGGGFFPPSLSFKKAALLQTALELRIVFQLKTEQAKKLS